MNNELINEDLLFAMSWKDKVLYLAAHRAEDELLRAFLRTKSEEEWWEEGLYDKEPSQNLDRAIGKVIWERNEFAHHHDIIEGTAAPFSRNRQSAESTQGNASAFKVLNRL